ncbi:hypothetical protein CEP52_017785 [Fusarium oligoseptatum]|uniref:Uncharacterized protein n=1 Tax=Fusarium oligoseptatum TaxID=2604345 RepID=A0A428RG31_9HYPO|nr:hypothetical protein CEP52_017785 [Fusarium oligoseptatum]
MPSSWVDLRRYDGEQPAHQSFASADVHETRRSVVGARTVLSFGTNPTPFECTIVALKKENQFYVSAGRTNPFD